MRRFFSLYNEDGNKINYHDSKFYTYNDYDDLVPVIDMETETGVIISNFPNLRERDHLTDTLRRTANETLNKFPRTSSISLNRFSCDAPGVVVSQGPDVDPVIKSFDSVFQSVVYKIDSDEALIFEGSTMNSSFFEDSSTVNNCIFDGKFINKNLFYPLEIKRVINGLNLYTSAKVSVDFTPPVVDIVSINEVSMTNEDLHNKITSIESFILRSAYELDTRTKFTFHIVNNDGTVRSFICNFEDILDAEDDLLQHYRFFPDEMSIPILSGDQKIYMGDMEVRTSFTPSLDYNTNYVIGELDSLRIKYNYDTEIRGNTNDITINIPVNISLRDIDISEHHGVYINENYELKGFGLDKRGEISLDKIPTGRFEQVACGKYHNVAIKEDGTLVSWGEDRFNQVTDTPQGIFKKVYAYEHISVAISEDNDLFIWGDTLYYDSEIDINLNNIIDVAIGERFMIALKDDGTLVGIGDDSYSQISGIPLNVEFESIDAGRYHVAGFSKSNSFYAWGKTDDNQLINTNILDEVIKVQCTDFGGAVLTMDGLLKPFGELSNVTVGHYNDLVSGYSNLILLKNEEILFEKNMKMHNSSGDCFNLRIDIENHDLVIHKILAELNILN
jgi:hypothetical protein